MKGSSFIIPAEQIERSIFHFRGVKVMLSSDLADLYGVAVKALNQAVRRNIDRFPDDFMFQLTPEEFNDLKSQFVTSSWGGMRRALPYAFTEQGIAMLSGVLKSPRAIRVNIEIMRAFVKPHQMLASNAELARKLDELEKKYDRQFKIVFDAIRQLMSPSSAKAKPDWLPSWNIKGVNAAVSITTPDSVMQLWAPWEGAHTLRTILAVLGFASLAYSTTTASTPSAL